MRRLCEVKTHVAQVLTLAAPLRELSSKSSACENPHSVVEAKWQSKVTPLLSLATKRAATSFNDKRMASKYSK